MFLDESVLGRKCFWMKVHLTFVAPTWDAPALDACPPPRESEDGELGGVRRGWQHSAAQKWRNVRETSGSCAEPTK